MLNVVNVYIFIQCDGGEVNDVFEIILFYGIYFVQFGLIFFEVGVMLRFVLYGDKGSYRKYVLDLQEDQLKVGLCFDDFKWVKILDI